MLFKVKLLVGMFADGVDHIGATCDAFQKDNGEVILLHPKFTYFTWDKMSGTDYEILQPDEPKVIYNPCTIHSLFGSNLKSLNVEFK